MADKGDAALQFGEIETVETVLEFGCVVVLVLDGDGQRSFRPPRPVHRRYFEQIFFFGLAVDQAGHRHVPTHRVDPELARRVLRETVGGVGVGPDVPVGARHLNDERSDRRVLRYVDAEEARESRRVVVLVRNRHRHRRRARPLHRRTLVHRLHRQDVVAHLFPVQFHVRVDLARLSVDAERVVPAAQLVADQAVASRV